MQLRPYLYNILSLFLIMEHADTAVWRDKNETHCTCSPLKRRNERSKSFYCKSLIVCLTIRHLELLILLYCKSLIVCSTTSHNRILLILPFASDFSMRFK